MQRRPYQPQHQYNYGQGQHASPAQANGYYQGQQRHDPYNTAPQAPHMQTAVPHVPIDVSTRNRNARKNSGGCSIITVLFLILLTAGAVAGCGYFYVKDVLMVEYKAELQREEVEPITEYWTEKFATLDRDHQKLQSSSMTLRRELRTTEHALDDARGHADRELQELRDSMQRQIDEAWEHANNNNNNDQQVEVVHADTSHLDRRIEELDGMALHLQYGIQELSKRAAIAKYGPGPYRVEIELAFNQHVQETRGEARFFVVETAPLDMMPHSIYWFLEQVDQKLFQTNSFYINVPHVVQAGPRSKLTNTASEAILKRYEESGFKSLYFQEYNPDFTHHPWTMGFAGRPAGPEFYINLHENIGAHGPGGQGPGGDPCFAKVISGFDTIERMMKTPGLPDDPAIMKKTVGVRRAVILRD